MSCSHRSTAAGMCDTENREDHVSRRQRLGCPVVSSSTVRSTPPRSAALVVLGIAAGLYGAILWIPGAPRNLVWAALAGTNGAMAVATIAILCLLWPFVVSAFFVVGALMLVRHGSAGRLLIVGAALAIPLWPADVLGRTSLGAALYGSVPSLFVLPMTAAGVGVFVLRHRRRAADLKTLARYEARIRREL